MDYVKTQEEPRSCMIAGYLTQLSQLLFTAMPISIFLFVPHRKRAFDELPQTANDYRDKLSAPRFNNSNCKVPLTASYLTNDVTINVVDVDFHESIP
jgi:hypothetical protein